MGSMGNYSGLLDNARDSLSCYISNALLFFRLRLNNWYFAHVTKGMTQKFSLNGYVFIYPIAA